MFGCLDSSGEDDSDDDEDTNRSQQETHDEVKEIIFSEFVFIFFLTVPIVDCVLPVELCPRLWETPSFSLNSHALSINLFSLLCSILCLGTVRRKKEWLLKAENSRLLSLSSVGFECDLQL